MPDVLTLGNLDLDFEERQSSEIEERQRTVRCALSKDAKHRVDLSWNEGGRFGRVQPLFLYPGKSVVLPIARAQHFFGPFAAIVELQGCTDEKRRADLKYTIRTESKRILNQYDYERPLSKGKDGYEPIGPHRFPDVTVTIVNSDESEEVPLRLHQLYQIGEFDPLRDQLVPRATIAETAARHKTELEEADQAAQKRIRELEIEAAKALGVVKGVVAAVGKS